MCTVRRITTSDDLYAQERLLREAVLLRPIGYDLDRFSEEYPRVDLEAEHFVAVRRDGGEEMVVGCALLLPHEPDEGSGKVMQVAVDEEHRGRGIGRRLMEAVQSYAFEDLGLERVVCHAQLPAVAFYKTLGWTVSGDVFSEAGVDHLKMGLGAPEANGRVG